MIDPEIQEQIKQIQTYVDSINLLMQSLHEKDVEIRIHYKDPSRQTAPSIALWRATEHINYLKDTQ